MSIKKNLAMLLEKITPRLLSIVLFYLDHVANGYVPQKIEYTPVIDEVEAEADDESSEVDREEGKNKVTIKCMSIATWLKTTL